MPLCPWENNNNNKKGDVYGLLLGGLSFPRETETSVLNSNFFFLTLKRDCHLYLVITTLLSQRRLRAPSYVISLQLFTEQQFNNIPGTD